MTDKDYKPLPPEEDENLRKNPHYWLYKVTREALDNKDKNHPLADMGHIWNRWACEGLSEEEKEKFNLTWICSLDVLTAEEKKSIAKTINREIKFFLTKSIRWRFPCFGVLINFINTEWSCKIDFSDFIFSDNVSFLYARFTQNANFSYTKFILNIDLNHAKFGKDANFNYARFNRYAYLGKIEFHEKVNFSKAEFTGNIIKFNKAKFFKPTNSESIFSFQNTIFATKVNFSKSEFHHLPDLTGTDFRAGINLDKVKFPSDFCHCESCKARRSNPENNDKQNNPRGLKLDCHSPLQGLRNDEEIKGGLSPKDAAITWHALSTEMEKAGYHDQALTYFGYELEAKRLNPLEGGFFKKLSGLFFWFILSLYKFFSNYGRSIALPFIAWVVLFCFFVAVYYYQVNDFIYSLKFAFKGLLPFVSDNTTFFDRMFINADAIKQCPINTSLSHEPFVFNNNLELLAFPFLYGFHTLFSLILIFLFGLGVRNRLRLK